MGAQHTHTQTEKNSDKATMNTASSPFTTTKATILLRFLLLGCCMRDSSILEVTAVAVPKEDVEQMQQPRFFYENTSDLEEQIMAPEDWDLVDCDDPATCPGWPTDWESLSPYIGNITNTCFDCTTSIRRECQYQQQSPIDLWRNITGNRDCKDRHRMYFQRGSCNFDDLRFEILPHVLRVKQPEIPCSHPPNIDYSFGFPDPWILVYTDIAIPSLHRQEGRRYDAEVIMSHVYSVDNIEKQIGNVAVFFEQGTEDDHYEFLEMHLERWRQEQDRILNACNDTSGSSTTRRSLVADGTKLDNLGKDTRKIMQGPKKIFNPYDWYKQSRTHYYFRYEGSTPEPPCVEGVHWRVLKDPVKVAPSQLVDLRNLLVNRVDPMTCSPYTAARTEADGSVHANRPLQRRRPSHLVVFCECVDWEPSLSTDQAFCSLPPEERGVITRPKEPTPAPSATPAPTTVKAVCECPSEKSQYLCQLFQLIHPNRSPVCF